MILTLIIEMARNLFFGGRDEPYSNFDLFDDEESERHLL